LKPIRRAPLRRAQAQTQAREPPLLRGYDQDYDESEMTLLPRPWRDPNMPTSSTVQDLNRELARRINEEARRDPQSPYANKFVGIANGKVVAIVDDLEELAHRLRQVESNPSKTFWVEASRDYDEAIEIWGLR
jgi:hypothetical protein